MKEKLLVIVGPTAVGKSKLSIDLASYYNAEVISGDSMQVYQGMDIGTAKVTKHEMQGIPHHLIDIARPDEAFSVSKFQQLCVKKIREINERNTLPILVGGTGLYVQAVIQQFQFPDQQKDDGLRQKWSHYVHVYGKEALYEQLVKQDEEYSRTVHPNNVRRVIRALEVIERTGEKMSAYQAEWEKDSPYDVLIIGLTMDRTVLYERINQRVDQMLDHGLVSEVQNLLAQGVPANATALQAIGYKEIVTYLQGDQSYESAVNMLKRNTRRFAKRQLTWFRRMQHIYWYDVTDLSKWSDHVQNIQQVVEGKFSRLSNILNQKKDI